jgi:hypothetical protein
MKITHAGRKPIRTGPAKEHLPSDDPDTDTTSFTPDQHVFTEKRRELRVVGLRIPLGRWKPV